MRKSHSRPALSCANDSTVSFIAAIVSPVLLSRKSAEMQVPAAVTSGLDRRAFLQAAGGAALMAWSGPRAPAAGPGPWREHFPALDQRVNGHPLVFLDSAASTQRPMEVIDAIAEFYRRDNANPSATLHALARRANDRYEGA